MSDLLLQLSQNRFARSFIKSVGLPVPLPQRLRRASGPWEERPLQDQPIVVGAARGGTLEQRIAETLSRAGASPLVVGDTSHWTGVGVAHGPLAHPLALASLPSELRANALVFDATGVDDPAALRALYEFFHPLISHLDPSGRVVVIARPAEEAKDAAQAAARRALPGFIRSLGREIGKKGATANLVVVAADADDRLEGVLRFLLSSRSAFISGQVLNVTAQAAARGELRWIRPLDKKSALVTGAARGIGAATARLLAAEGAHVICLDRPADEPATSALARELSGSVLFADVSAPDAAEKIAEALAKQHGGVDVVVHNAGVTRDKTLARMKVEQWDQAVEINLGAVIRITHELLRRKLIRDGGRIICLSSVAGIAGNMGQTNYSASKAGIIGFAEHEARALADRGITVNAVAPGLIETRLTEAIPLVIREVARRLSNLGQGGQPQDVGETIAFLASPGASGLTGSVLRVCGGAWVGA